MSKKQIKKGGIVTIVDDDSCDNNEQDLSGGASFKLIDVLQGKVKLTDNIKIEPLDLNTLANLEEEFGCSFIDSEGFELKTIGAMRKFLWVLCKQNEPNITIEDVGKSIDLNQMPEINKALVKMMQPAGNSQNDK